MIAMLAAFLILQVNANHDLCFFIHGAAVRPPPQYQPFTLVDSRTNNRIPSHIEEYWGKLPSDANCTHRLFVYMNTVDHRYDDE